VHISRFGLYEPFERKLYTLSSKGRFMMPAKLALPPDMGGGQKWWDIHTVFFQVPEGA
jgi:hypothetical protein